MNTTTWQKACTCEGATATSGRITLYQRTTDDGNLIVGALLNIGPVCDRCGTPWTPVLDAPQRALGARYNLRSS